MPLYRQSAMLERDTGLELSRATPDGWVLRVGELLVPVVAAMKGELIGGGTFKPMKLQSRDFRLGRGREGPKQFLGEFVGILQSDGYAAANGVGGAQLVHAAC